MDDEAPVKPSVKTTKLSLKSKLCSKIVLHFLSLSIPSEQWNTRSRKRKADDGHSVDSTDTEDDLVSSQTSAVSSPAHSLG